MEVLSTLKLRFLAKRSRLSEYPLKLSHVVLQASACHRFYSSDSKSSPPSAFGVREKQKARESDIDDDDDAVPTSGISRPLSEILKELNKKVPSSLLRQRVEDGFSFKYIPWHLLNKILNLYAPEWSGDVRSITYSADGKSVSVIYRLTIYGTDAEIYRESTGTAAVDDRSYGNPVQKAEAIAFRRACARFGLGLHLYYEDM